jgi:hypothetical protein
MLFLVRVPHNHTLTHVVGAGVVGAGVVVLVLLVLVLLVLVLSTHSHILSVQAHTLRELTQPQNCSH